VHHAKQKSFRLLQALAQDHVSGHGTPTNEQTKQASMISYCWSIAPVITQQIARQEMAPEGLEMLLVFGDVDIFKRCAFYHVGKVDQFDRGSWPPGLAADPQQQVSDARGGDTDTLGTEIKMHWFCAIGTTYLMFNLLEICAIITRQGNGYSQHI